MAKIKESTQRPAEHKPLLFSTTMRNPQRIVGFLNCVIPYEGQILTNEIIAKIIKKLISEKLYTPIDITKSPKLKEILHSESSYSQADLDYVYANSKQDHKEAGFEKGWPSRFDTMYKLPMEFGFIYYEMKAPIIISNVGHMLVDAYNETTQNDEKIQNVFLNALMKYQTHNPFRKNANKNVPLLLLLNTIKELKRLGYDNGISRKEIPLFLCWNDANHIELAKYIIELRREHGFTYSDETMYDICLNLLGVDYTKSKRFKMSNITGEVVDEYIRKMRITGVISLRGAGRFLDINSFEEEKVNYVIAEYSQYPSFSNKKDYFDYIGQIDTKVIAIKHKVVGNIKEIKVKALEKWAVAFEKKIVLDELGARSTIVSPLCSTSPTLETYSQFKVYSFVEVK